MNKKQAFYALAILVLAGAAIGFWLYARKTPDVVNAKPDYVFTAADLTRAFEQDARAADARFREKVIQVSGTVKNVSNAGAVILESNGTPSEVVVGMDQRHQRDVGKLRVGTQTVLQGVYSGFEQGSGAAGDLLSSLGATVQLRAAGLKKNN